MGVERHHCRSCYGLALSTDVPASGGKDGQPQEPPRWSPNKSDGSRFGFEKKPSKKKKKFDFSGRLIGRIALNREFSLPLSPLILSL